MPVVLRGRHRDGDFVAGIYQGVLFASAPVGRGGSRPGQREMVGCQEVSTEAWALQRALSPGMDVGCLPGEGAITGKGAVFSRGQALQRAEAQLYSYSSDNKSLSPGRTGGISQHPEQCC